MSIIKTGTFVAIAAAMAMAVSVQSPAQADIFGKFKSFLTTTHPYFWQAVVAGRVARKNGVLRQIGVNDENSCVHKAGEIANKLGGPAAAVIKIARRDFCREVF